MKMIRNAARMVAIEPQDVRDKVEAAQLAMNSSQKESLNAMIAKDEDRRKVLVRMMSKLYEDRIAGLISEENFDQLR